MTVTAYCCLQLHLSFPTVWVLWVTEQTFSQEAPGLQISGCSSLKVEFQGALMGPVRAEPEQVPCDGAAKYLQREMLETWGAKGIHITGGEGLSYSCFSSFFCVYTAFSSPLCRMQLYYAGQKGTGMQKKVALIVTRRTRWVSWECGGLEGPPGNCF